MRSTFNQVRIEEALNIPPEAPAPVAEAHSKYAELVARLKETRSERRQAEAAVKTAIKADVQAAADAIAAGKEPPAKPGVNEMKAAAELHQLETKLAALTQLVDTSGDDVVRAIDDAKEDWGADLLERRERVVAAYGDAIAAALETLDDLHVTANAITWLSGLSFVVSSLNGALLDDGDCLFNPAAGGLFVVDGRESRDVRQLLNLAATLTPPMPVAEAAVAA